MGDESLDSMKEILAVPLMNKLPSMAMYALREAPRKAVACLVDLPMMDPREGVPFDDMTFVENMSPRGLLRNLPFWRLSLCWRPSTLPWLKHGRRGVDQGYFVNQLKC